MKTRKLRLLSALLALAMMLALLPTTAFAENSIVDSGNCGANGDNLKWVLSDDGTLTISGTGAMTDFVDANIPGSETIINYPWKSHISEIEKIVIEDGVTSIGNYAFFDSSNVTEAVIPDSVTSIGKRAFSGSATPKIVGIKIPAGIKSVGEFAFANCSELTTVDFSQAISLETVGLQAFGYCTKLTDVKLKGAGNLQTIGSGAFTNSGVTQIEIPASVKKIEDSAFYGCGQLQSVVFEPDSKLETIEKDTFGACYALETISCDENVKQKLLAAGAVDESKIETYPSEPTIPDSEPEKYPITIDYGNAYDADHNAITKAAAGEEVTIEADETAFDGMVFEYWKDHNGNVTLANDHAAKTNFEMPDGEVRLEAMYKSADNDDTSWDAATVVTGVAIGTGTAILAYHIGTELYAEQVLGKGVAVPRTRAEVALLAWQLAGSPTVELNGEPLSEAAQAEKWAVESGLMQLDAEGNFNGAKKMSKLKALRTLEKAKQ